MVPSAKGRDILLTNCAKVLNAPIAFNFYLCKWKADLLTKELTESCSYVNYSRLVVLSFAYQSAIEKGIIVDDQIIMRVSVSAVFISSATRLTLNLQCLDAASSVIAVIVNVLAPTEYLRCMCLVIVCLDFLLIDFASRCPRWSLRLCFFRLRIPSQDASEGTRSITRSGAMRARRDFGPTPHRRPQITSHCRRRATHADALLAVPLWPSCQTQAKTGAKHSFYQWNIFQRQPLVERCSRASASETNAHPQIEPFHRNCTTSAGTSRSRHAPIRARRLCHLRNPSSSAQRPIQPNSVRSSPDAEQLQHTRFAPHGFTFSLWGIYYKYFNSSRIRHCHREPVWYAYEHGR